MKTHYQETKFSSPWSFKEKLIIFTWELSWLLFCKWTPKNFNLFRLQFLKIFGAKIYGNPFVHQRAEIYYPWNVCLHDKSCIGDRAVLYAWNKIEINEESLVAQESYLCTASHDFNNDWILISDPIIIGKKTFIGARTFILPGVKVGDNVIIGACSVVTKDVPDNTTAVGNPAKVRLNN